MGAWNRDLGKSISKTGSKCCSRPQITRTPSDYQILRASQNAEVLWEPSPRLLPSNGNAMATWPNEPGFLIRSCQTKREQGPLRPPTLAGRHRSIARCCTSRLGCPSCSRSHREIQVDRRSDEQMSESSTVSWPLQTRPQPRTAQLSGWN
jgi:hypothetical protein